jgi:putative transposase
MKKRFTEEQIIGVLKEAETGLKLAELCRKHGIEEATYYNWKAKYGGMTVFRSAAPEGAGAGEQQAQAPAGRIDARQRGAKGPAVPKVASPQANREAVQTLMTERAMGVTRACGLVPVSRRLVQSVAARVDVGRLRRVAMSPPPIQH